MAVPFKLTPGERAIIMNHPIHYNLSLRFNSKSNKYEGEAETPAQVKEINKILNPDTK